MRTEGPREAGDGAAPPPTLPFPVAADTAAVPFRLEDGVHIPAERYYDPGFAALENTRMWLRTWQWAARLEDVQRPGDYIAYRIAGETVMVLRVDAETVKVFHNVCPHRATEIVQDCGSFAGGQIVCPFHGWRWNLDGSLSFLYGRSGFAAGSVDPDKVSLKEVRSDIRHGFVWINFDPGAEPLEQFLGGMEKHLAPLGMDLMRVRWWKYALLQANWKVALEAFMEGYHVMQTHPELAMGATGDDYDLEQFQYIPMDHGHVNTGAGMIGPDGMPLSPVPGMGFGEWYLEQNRVLFEGTDAYATIREELIADRVRHRDLPDEHLVPAFFQEYYRYAKDAGIPLPRFSLDATGYAYVFPNMVMLGIPGNLLFYRVRPNGTDPERCIFEVFALQIPPAGEPEQAPARPEGPLAVDDWPFILRQDFENIVRQQIGYRSGSFEQSTLSPRHEPMIFSMHNEIDRLLAR